MKKFRDLKLNTRTSLTAHAFLIPFYIGIIVFFLVPLVNSLIMSFSNVIVTDNGYKYDFIKFQNYIYAFNKDPSFGTNLVQSIGEMLWKVPTVNVFAIFLALIANGKYKGRTFVRAVFFLPLIFASGVAFDCINSDYVAQNIMSGSDMSGGTVSNTNALKTMLIASGIGSQIVSLVTKITDSIFSMAWSSGVPMILYLAGLQSISPSLYEASQIEGASSWDNFWKITLPMLNPIMVICFVYAIVDNFTAASNVVMKQISSVSAQGVDNFGMSSAFSWVYTVLVLIIILIAIRLLSGGRERGRR